MSLTANKIFVWNQKHNQGLLKAATTHRIEHNKTCFDNFYNLPLLKCCKTSCKIYYYLIPTYTSHAAFLMQGKRKNFARKKKCINKFKVYKYANFSRRGYVRWQTARLTSSHGLAWQRFRSSQLLKTLISLLERNVVLVTVLGIWTMIVYFTFN